MRVKFYRKKRHKGQDFSVYSVIPKVSLTETYKTE
ncbi:MAG: hypothetical protein A4E32_00507 [Methanomassiliicoccales archaeon PtaU1.Bin124]|nr:MAG: hypothetical protein A4E32_00507 [Methanomassiliicoccales archaeon PtaU1.Bin124]